MNPQSLRRITLPIRFASLLAGCLNSTIARPADCTISLRFTPNDNTGEYGILLRMDERMERGYRLIFIPHQKRMRLERGPENYNKPGAAIRAVDDLDGPTRVAAKKQRGGQSRPFHQCVNSTHYRSCWRLVHRQPVSADGLWILHDAECRSNGPVRHPAFKSRIGQHVGST